MRILAFLISLVCIVSNCYAQPYKSIFGKVSTEFYFYTTNGNEVVQLIYGSDIIYNGMMYKRLNNGSYLGEDTLTGMVAMVTPEMIGFGEPPFVLWSFDLTKGDTLESYAFGYPVRVDTVYYIDSLKVIVTDAEYYGPPLFTGQQVKFIEGTGCTFGFPVYFDMYHDYAAPQALLCVFKDGIKTFQNADSVFQGSCAYGGLDENLPAVHAMVYPNPANDHVNILLPAANNPLRVTLFDDKLMYIKEISTFSGSTRLNLDDLNPGLYFLCIRISDKCSYYKIIKI